MTSEPGETAQGGVAARGPTVRFGLSFKLLLFTILFVMICEVLVYVPSVAMYRENWLRDRLATAETASVVLSASQWAVVPRAIQDELLATVGADAIAVRSGDVSRLLAAVEMPPAVDETADLRQMQPVHSILAAFRTLLAGEARTLRIVDRTSSGILIELVMNDRALRAAMIGYSFNILAISALISIVTASFVYVALNRLLVRPMRRMSLAMVAFSDRPEDAARIIAPSGRRDEIGVAEEHLAVMQKALRETLQQQRHLADLGLAVSKINHDLRNMLASAQLLSDRLGASSDPTVQRFAPKLIAALDRAIAYCQSTLAYGKPREPAPERRLMSLRKLVEDVGEALGLEDNAAIRFDNNVPPGMEIDADPDQMFRVLVNLGRNAMQAMEGSSEAAVVRRLTVEADRAGSVVRVRMRDTGPGVPDRARAHLFQAFQGSVRPGGTGLGLAIAAELVRAHGGELRLAEERSTTPGATFEIAIPDRPLDLERARGARRA